MGKTSSFNRVNMASVQTHARTHAHTHISPTCNDKIFVHSELCRWERKL